jgi:hypothetical protein
VDTDEEGDAPVGDAPSFRDIGVCEELCRSIDELGWKKPSAIQVQSLPVALKGHDVIGLAKTGSGKTAAFAIPILQVLTPQPQKNLCGVAHALPRIPTAAGCSCMCWCALLWDRSPRNPHAIDRGTLDSEGHCWLPKLCALMHLIVQSNVE